MLSRIWVEFRGIIVVIWSDIWLVSSESQDCSDWSTGITLTLCLTVLTNLSLLGIMIQEIHLTKLCRNNLSSHTAETWGSDQRWHLHLCWEQPGGQLWHSWQDQEQWVHLQVVEEEGQGQVVAGEEHLLLQEQTPYSLLPRGSMSTSILAVFSFQYFNALPVAVELTYIIHFLDIRS